MGYKVIISDFDNTLLRTDYTVSKASADAIRAYRNAGGLFTISTGRMYASIKKQLEACGLDKVDVPIMNCQGALAQSSLTGKVLFEVRIDTDLALKWLEFVKANNFYCQVYVDDVLYVEKWTKETALYTDASQVDAVEVGDLAKWIQKTNHRPHKMLVMDDADKTVKYMDRFTKNFEHLGLSFTMSHPTLIEITSSDAGKGNMAKKVVESLGFDMQDTICIGDSQNDLTMLSMAGFGVAVANAVPQIKEIAKLVVESCDDDGVAKLIYRVLNNQI